MGSTSWGSKGLGLRPQSHLSRSMGDGLFASFNGRKMEEARLSTSVYSKIV